MLLKRRHEFEGFIFSVPVNITCCSDGSIETGKVMFMNDYFKRFDISFESNFTLFEDFQDDKRYHKSSYKYNDRTLHFIRQQKSKIGFFRFDIPNKSREIQTCPGQIFVATEKQWESSAIPVLMELMKKIQITS